jgi:hypothetical protein
MGKGASAQLSKHRGSINKSLTVCLQREGVLEYEKNRKYFNFKTNYRVLQMIPWEENCGFLRRNRDIHMLPSQNFERSNSSNSITHLERS